MMDRKMKLLSGLDMSTSIGVEIGALCRPIVTHGDGAIYYVDHASSDELREKYKSDPNVDIDSLVNVDAVWGRQSLSEALGGKRFNYIIASHVVEHVPDLVGWFTELSTILAPDGHLRLVVPDKRFTFDLMRQESHLSDVLSAYVLHARIPQPRAVIDHVMNVRYDVSASAIWLGQQSDGRPAHTFEDAIATAQDAIANGTYHDVHCWVFTPASFASMCRLLVENGLLHMSCINFFDTERNELEFQVHMQKCDDAVHAAETWKRMEEVALPFDPHALSARARRAFASARNLARRLRRLL
jgi:predicted SAM-dependent methyltransferase